MKYFVLTFLLFTGFFSVSFSTDPIRCQGMANGHLQGFDSDGKYIYWSMYSSLIKTDYTGKVIAQVPVTPHHGDCCIHKGRLYVATIEKRGNFITVYDCRDLSHITDYPIDFGYDNLEGIDIDGITFFKGHFYVGEGKDPKSEQEFNWIHKYTPGFKHVKKIKIPGKTKYGIQTISYTNGFFWLGTYSNEKTYQCDKNFNIIGYHTVNISVGAYGLPLSNNGEIRLMVARNIKLGNDKWSADCVPAVLRNGKLEWEEK